EKAERYRLLNEPAEAESICLDVLTAEPENQEALIILLLAVTDRFSKSYGVSDTQAREILRRITGEYEQAYYNGILAERRAKAQLARGTPGCAHQAFERAGTLFPIKVLRVKVQRAFTQALHQGRILSEVDYGLDNSQRIDLRQNPRVHPVLNETTNVSLRHDNWPPHRKKFRHFRRQS